MNVVVQDPQYHWRVQVVSLKGLYSEQNLVFSRAGFTCWVFTRSVGELRPISLSSLSVEVYGLISALVAMCVSLGEVAPRYLYSLKIRSWKVVVPGWGGVKAELQDPQYKFSYVWVCPSLLVYLLTQSLPWCSKRLLPLCLGMLSWQPSSQAWMCRKQTLVTSTVFPSALRPQTVEVVGIHAGKLMQMLSASK